jgi:hypothetical protein
MRVRLTACLIVICLAGISAGALAADVSLDVSTHEAFVDEPVEVKITIIDPQKYSPPKFPQIDGARVQVDPRSTRESTGLQQRGGRWIRSKSVTYAYVVIPQRVGPLVIPPIAVEVDGRKFMTVQTVVQVVESKTDNLLYVDITSAEKSVYLGESIKVDLEIWLAPYGDRNVRMDPNDMLSRIDFESSRFGVFQDQVARLRTGQERFGFRNDTRVDDDGVQRAYYVYIISNEFVPTQTGPLDVGEVSVLVSYPMQTGRNDDILSMLNRYRITKTRPVRASPGNSEIEVKAPPDAGQPEYFRGAVGEFAFAVTASSTQVRVREPIEITMTIRGSGPLERVPPPPLADMAFLTRDFRVPEGDVAGLSAQGRKHFKVKIGAKHDGVTEIPAIPFVYYDPETSKYVTRWSEPIPLAVEASEELAISQFAEAPAPRSTSALQLTETGPGIRANYIDPGEVLAQQGFAPGWGTVTLLAGCPAVFAAISLVRRRQERLQSDPGIRRRRKAAAAALQAIQQASQQGALRESATQVAGAVVHYMADRCNLPMGLTRAEVVEELARRGVAGERVAAMDSFLQECEALQFAGVDSGGGSDLPERAERIVLAMERERL